MLKQKFKTSIEQAICCRVVDMFLGTCSNFKDAQVEWDYIFLQDSVKELARQNKLLEPEMEMVEIEFPTLHDLVAEDNDDYSKIDYNRLKIWKTDDYIDIRKRNYPREPKYIFKSPNFNYLIVILSASATNGCWTCDGLTTSKLVFAPMTIHYCIDKGYISKESFIEQGVIIPSLEQLEFSNHYHDVIDYLRKDGVVENRMLQHHREKNNYDIVMLLENLVE